MKKLLTLVSILLAVVLLAASCTTPGNGTTDSSTAKDTGTAAPAVLTQDDVDAAAEMVYTMNKPGENNIVANTFTLPAVLDYEDNKLSITWTVEGGDGLVTIETAEGSDVAVIKVNKYADADTEFTVKGVVTSGEMTAARVVTFTYVIKEYSIATWAYWAENTKDVTMNVKGVIVAKYPYSADNKNTGVFLQDLDGEHGYFAYRMKCDSQEAYDTDLAIGNVIVVNGKTSIYNGWREMGAGCTYEVVKNEDGSVLTGNVVKIAIDEKVAADENLDSYQDLIVTLTGFKVKAIDWNTNNAETYEEKGAGSVYITLTKDGKDVKLYYSTSNQFTLEQLKAEYEKLAIGYTVNVEGPLAWYNTPQIYPCAGGVTVTSTEVSAEDKVANEKGKVSFPLVIDSERSFPLAAQGAVYNDVTLQWALNEGAQSAKIENGQLVVTPKAGAVETITLTLTLTCGEVIQEETYSIIVGEMTPENIVNTAYGLANKKTLSNMTLTGVVTKITTAYSDQFKNITFVIVVNGMWEKPLTCFRVKGESDKIDLSKLAIGNTVTLKGDITNYDGTIEYTQTALVTAVEATEASAAVKLHYAVDAVSISENIEKDTELTLATADATYTDVALAWALSEGAQMAKIENGKLIVTPAEGEPESVTLTLTATVGEENLVKTFAITIQKADLTPEQIVERAYALSTTDSPMEDVTLSGTALVDGSKIYIVVSGMVDKKIQCYKLAGAEGVDISNLATGDNITVNGTIKNFKGTIEFDSGCKVTEIYRVSDILTDAFALENKATLAKPVTLTGEIKRLDKSNNPYIFVTGMEEGKEIECYKLKGAEGVDITGYAVGDTVTVYGIIKNYNSTIEFDNGCVAYRLDKAPAAEA